MIADKPVEVVIACHSPRRAVQRAVSSVLNGNVEASVTVVAHNVAPELLQETMPLEHRQKVRWLHLEDGTRSPANPYNYGTGLARAPWVSLLGSDDYLQPGAVRAWLAQSRGADAVIARSLHDSGRAVHTPPVRLFPHRFRNPVLDRLYYRSAPLGLMSRKFLEASDLRWDHDLGSGGDARLSSMLWSTGKTSVQRRGPAYVIGSDADDRVTLRLPPIAEELANVSMAWEEDGWAHQLTHLQQVSLAIKTIRVPIFGAAYYRSLRDAWRPGDRGSLRDITSHLLAVAPAAARPFSIADHNLIEGILDLSVPDHEIGRLVRARRRFGTAATLVTKDLRYLFDREAPLRFMTASALTS